MPPIRLAALAPLALLAANPAASYYQAETAAARTAAQVITRDSVWRCADTHCAAPRSGSRPAIVCALLVREVGALRSFTAQGRPLSADELENCNRRAS